jgi:hypothetical protein
LAPVTVVTCPAAATEAAAATGFASDEGEAVFATAGADPPVAALSTAGFEPHPDNKAITQAVAANVKHLAIRLDMRHLREGAMCRQRADERDEC